MNRRQFLHSALCSSFLYGVGGIPGLSKQAHAGFNPVQKRLAANCFMGGGPDMRHFIVPAFDSQTDSFGYKYWKHRWVAHDLTEDPNSWQQRWEDDYFHFTVGGDNWDSNLADESAGKNSGQTFGIWKHAGWLIDMFRAGNVAIISNAVGGTNRAHDLSSLQMHQGNLLSGLNDMGRSGWGGRLARSAGGNPISITNTPLAFTFGPDGNAPNYNPNAVDNRDLISVQNSRELGLNEANLEQDQLYRPEDRMARALKNYYQGLREEQIATAYEKFRDHENKVRTFGELIRDQLSDLPEPDLVRVLRDTRDENNEIIRINGDIVNPDADGDARRVLRNGYGFGSMMRNFYDCLAANDLLNLSTISMSYGGWDSHADQRRNGGNPDYDDPNVNRGIESGFKDMFGGQFGADPSDSTQLHSGFSALWAVLNQVDREKIVLTVAGEFGRQIRANGDAGTDHGKGNIMFIIGHGVRGGLYGEMFQDGEVDKYDDESLNTPDIDPKTELDHFYAKVADWVSPGSGSAVFPRTAPGYGGEAPIIEVPGMFDNLMN